MTPRQWGGLMFYLYAAALAEGTKHEYRWHVRLATSLRRLKRAAIKGAAKE